MPGKFSPHYFCWLWENEYRKKFVSVVLHVPSGLLIDGEFAGRVFPMVGNGKQLNVHVEMLTSMYKSSTLVEGFRESIDPRSRSMGNMLHAFECCVDEVRERMNFGAFQNLGSTCTIELPVPCEQDIEFASPIVDEDEGCILFILLKARAKSTKQGNCIISKARKLGEDHDSPRDQYPSYSGKQQYLHSNRYKSDGTSTIGTGINGKTEPSCTGRY
jgi:hypothetical protein